MSICRQGKKKNKKKTPAQAATNITDKNHDKNAKTPRDLAATDAYGKRKTKRSRRWRKQRQSDEEVSNPP